MHTENAVTKVHRSSFSKAVRDHP